MNKEKKKIFTNSIIYAFRQVASLVFPLITFAYASRILGVDGLGLVNYTNSIANYFVIIAGLGIATYAIQTGSRIREDKTEINKFVTELFIINIISTLLSVLIYLIIIFSVNKLKDYRSLLLCFSLLIPFTTLGIEWVYNIFEDFLYITLRSIFFQFLSLVLMIIYVKDENDIFAYALITVISTVGSNVLNFIHVRKYIKPCFKNIDIQKHFKPVLFLFGMTIATTLYTTMDTTMLGVFSSNYQVGLYSAAHKVSKMLVILLATVRTVSLPLLSRYAVKDQEEYVSTSNEILSIVSMIVIPVSIGCFLFSSDILNILSGSKYVEANDVLKVLAIDVFLSALSGTFTYQYVLLKVGEKATFLVTVIGTITNLVLNYFFIIVFKALGAAVATCISEFVVLACVFLLSYKYVRMKSWFRHILISLFGCLPFLVLKTFSYVCFKGVNVMSLFIMILCIPFYFLIIIKVGNNPINKFYETVICKKLNN